MTKPFRYKKISRRERLPSVRVDPERTETTEYSGFIDGMKAAKGEENLYKAAYRTGAVIGHAFRLAVGAPRNMPGYKELDFLFLGPGGEYTAVQVRDYDFVHKGAKDEAQDLSDDAFILMKLGEMGISVRGNRIHSISDNDLETPEDAKRMVEAILL